MPKIIVNGTITSDHGDVTVTAGSTKTYANDELVARIGDSVDCPIHGATTISTTPAVKTYVEDELVALTGSELDCGAIITGENSDIDIEG